MDPHTEQQTPFDSDGVLYYPNIEFFSVDWLKLLLATVFGLSRGLGAGRAPEMAQNIEEAICFVL